MDGVSLVSAELASVLVESLLYGTFLVLFIASIYVLVIRHRRASAQSSSPKNHFRTGLLFQLISIFITITAHWIIAVLRTFDAFVKFIDDPGPLAYYTNQSELKNLVQTAFTIATFSPADCILVYRLYIVWGRSKAIAVFPACTTLGLFICGIGLSYQFSRFQPGQTVFSRASGSWITSSYVLTLVTNLYVTPMIAWRIWRTTRAVQQLGTSNLAPVTQILVESAAIYTAWIFAAFVSYQVGSNLQFPFLDTAPPIVGIAFCLIIVRIGLGVEHQPQVKTVPSSLLFDSIIHSAATGHGEGSYVLRPLEITITRHRHIAEDADDLDLKAGNRGYRYQEQFD